MPYHKFFAILSSHFILSEYIIRLSVYFWVFFFLIIRWAGRNQSEEDAASAWYGVDSAVFSQLYY